MVREEHVKMAPPMKSPLFASLLIAAGCQPHGVPLTATTPVPILLFNGTGTSPGDVRALEAVLDGNHLQYSTANSSQLDELGVERLRSYRLLIIPGGNFIEMGKGLQPQTLTRIHDAVESGASYLGICAGAFLAGRSTHYPSLDLAPVQFAFYAAESHGIRKTAVSITKPDSPPLDQYWEDGPQLGGWGDAVGRYPDGTPAIVEGASGKGWVILSGVHPEAPPSWRKGLSFRTPAEVDQAYAATLIRAALERTPLPHF
jgi:hypothetical protein